MGRLVADRETIDLKDVRAFCAVVDAGSVTAAAKLLRETKGSISRRIARLERALGVSLLRRSPRLVQPTEDGALYRTKVGRALELFEDASLSVQHAQEQPRGALRITAPFDFAMRILPELCARFVERYPEVRIEMVASDARLDFDAQLLDCALRVGTLRDSTLKVHKLLELNIAFFASPAYLLAHGTPKKPEDLSRHRVISYTNMPRPIEVNFVRAGTTTPVTLEPSMLGDGAFAHSVIAHGGGIGGIPTILAAQDVADGKLVQLLPNHTLSLTRPLSLLYPASTVVPAKVRAFRDFLLEALPLLGAPQPPQPPRRPGPRVSG